METVSAQIIGFNSLQTGKRIQRWKVLLTTILLTLTVSIPFKRESVSKGGGR